MYKSFFDVDIHRLDDYNDCVIILDQTLLPNEEYFVSLHTIEDFYNAIEKLKVRGAPAIGITAAFGLYLSVKGCYTLPYDEFYDKLIANKKYLASSRPTAVNLSWALNRIEKVAVADKHLPVNKIISLIKEEAIKIKEEDFENCTAIGNYGKSLINNNTGVLTHCNAGHLAVGKYGTALAPIYFAHQEGKTFRVYADETRPLLQGSRLTAFELQKSDIDVTLICDNMASVVMQKGLVNLILVGGDRVAANGDLANKIGTNTLAVLANYYQIPFYCCIPSSTIDAGCKDGNSIVVEERDGREITDFWFYKPMAPVNTKTFNPAFDITDHSLITGYITEKGIFSNIADAI
ncbi:MAG: S-methyl-5-thioribose-1-phosphate isomerase [Bacteroidales bacterium]|nr:S-methyl-5-thioribose-1-phosphate isomerase [Bacteroidales bacterium]